MTADGEKRPFLRFLPSMDSRMQRFKFSWRLLMAANFGLGAYIFAMSKKKDGGSKSEKHVAAPVPAGTSATTVDSLEDPKVRPATPTADVVQVQQAIPEEPEIAPATPIADLVKVLEPIPEDQQRELFKWILDEKRKLKPGDRDEKKQIDEEKSILKQFIKAKSIPSL